MKNIIQFFFSPTNTVENIKKYTTNSKIAIIFTCVLFSTLINTAFTIFGILPFGFNVLQFSLTFVTVIILNLIFTGIIFFIGKNLKNKIQGTFLDNLLFLVLSAVIFAFGPISNYIMTTNGLMIWSFLGTFFFLGWSLILMSKSLSKLNQISEGRVTFLVIGSVAVIYAIDYVLPFSLLGRDVAIPNNNIELPYEDINYDIQDTEELDASILETETPTLSHCDSGECGLEAGINIIKSGLSDIESGTFEDTKSINDPEMQDILSQFKPLGDENKENNSYENLSGKWVGSYDFNENSVNFSLDLKEKEGDGLPGYGTIYEGNAREVMKKEEGGILILKSNIEGFIKDGKIYLQKTYLTENDIFENVGMIGVIEDGTDQIEGTWETVSNSDYGDNRGTFQMNKKQEEYISVFNEYQTAINNRDIAKIYNITTQNFRSEMQEDGLDFESLGKIFDEAGIVRTNCIITSTKTIKEGIMLGCKGEFEYRDGRIIQEDDEDFFILVEIDKKWLIDSGKTE